MKRAKVEMWWCVKGVRTGMFPWTLRMRRNQAQAAFLLDRVDDWPECYRAGYRCVKIEVREAPKRAKVKA